MMAELSLTWSILIIITAILTLLASGMLIALAMGLIGIALILISGGSLASLGVLGLLQYNVVGDNFALVSLPLFIFMGYLVLEVGLAERIYDGSIGIVGAIPGGLLHANILSCAIFAAMCGSSVATAAALGAIAIPLEIDRHKYPPRPVLGSVAAGGTLGILIPPSVTFIAYGVFVGESIGQLFAAGIIPGIILASIFMTYIFVAAVINPATAGARLRFSLKNALSGVATMWSALLLIGLIIATIYLGFATPTEAAAVGCVIAAAIGFCYRRLTLTAVRKAAMASLYTTSFMILLIVTAQIVSLGLSNLEIPQRITAAIVEAGINKAVLFSLIVVMYLILGCFLEPGSMLFLTLPIVYPLMTGLGFSSIWLGVIMVILVEIANVTPPVGFNLFVIQGISGGRPMDDVVMGIIPYFFCMLLMIALLYVVPELATWLPNYLFGRG
jgi:tripartite ATP-independent transporter DctM subunit